MYKRIPAINDFICSFFPLKYHFTLMHVEDYKGVVN